jgi:hypothetical protein
MTKKQMVECVQTYFNKCKIKNWKKMKKKLMGRSPFWRLRSALDCSAIEEEEEEDDDDDGGGGDSFHISCSSFVHILSNCY